MEAFTKRSIVIFNIKLLNNCRVDLLRVFYTAFTLSTWIATGYLFSLISLNSYFPRNCRMRLILTFDLIFILRLCCLNINTKSEYHHY